MSARLGTWVLALLLVFAVGCNKPSQTQNGQAQSNQNSNDNSAQSPDNSQAANSSAPADNSANNSQQAPPVPTTLTVPSGRTLTIRLADDVGSKVSQPGQTFGGALARAVVVNGETAIPAGARVEGEVVDAKAMGHFKGGALLELRLNSIQVNGQQLPVQTATLTQTLKGKGKRTGIMAGGGAGLGALIGGLAGGGKGAAIGAVAGGGAGAAGAAYTGNKEILLPAESAVAFTLREPLKIRR
jgi:hypothetical protein